MDLKKKTYFVLVLILVFLFSGCSIGNFSFGSSQQTGGNIKVDNTGKGLEVTLSTDTSQIANRIVDISLTLENSGKEPITLTKNSKSFSLTTQSSDNSLNSLFDKTSLDKYLNVVFKGKNTLTIYQNQKIEIPTFPLKFNPTEFKNIDKNQIIVLHIEYDYKTDFSNNAQIDLKSRDLFKITDTISQAAPVQFIDAKLKMVDLDKYQLGFYFQDNGPSQKIKPSVTLKNIKLEFSNQDIYSSQCELWNKKDSSFEKSSNNLIQLSNLIPEVLITCPVDLSSNSKQFSTQISGSLEYKYSLNFEDKVTLPDKRYNTDSWS